jgi:pyruvate/oxaloacetate carboxyltransferase
LSAAPASVPAAVEILDSTLRDGQQSLWGMRMQAGMALPVADLLDRTGFSVIDFAGSSHMEVLLKYKREDPWRSTARRCAAACAPTPASPSGSRPTP